MPGSRSSTKPSAPKPQITSERWLAVVGWEGIYEVSDAGRVRSLPRAIRCHSGRPGWPHDVERQLLGQLLQPTIRKGGYPDVELKRGPRHAILKVHLLVLAAFRGPCPEGLEARHLDGNSANPRLDNLAYGTRVENMADKVRHGTDPQGERNGRAVLDDTSAAAIKTLYRRLPTGALASAFGVCGSSIKRAAKYRWTHVAPLPWRHALAVYQAAPRTCPERETPRLRGAGGGAPG